jgi:hypothetical protein
MRPWRAVSSAAAVALVVCTLAIGHVRLVALEVATVVAEAAASTVLAAPIAMSAGLREAAAATDARDRADDGRGRIEAAARAERRIVDEAQSDEPVLASEVEELPAAMRPAAFIDAPGIESSPAATASAPTAQAVDVLPEATSGTPAPSAAPPSVNDVARHTWTRATDAGVAIGRASNTAGKAAGGFFSRLGKRVAGSF